MNFDIYLCQNERQINNRSDQSFLENETLSDMTLDLIRSESSVQDDVLDLSEPLVQPEYRPDPNVILEVSRRQRMVWSTDLHRKFRFAVEALGGPKGNKNA
ncbi:unnamed protein product [Lactuca saligna]|uniref:Uncharacterized protein n=1 Tax=Lactuca saligna TaxID=75948 RepID=A0AA36E4E0_LACSI|nr:unnamed protein product [Lactuca saligna]